MEKGRVECITYYYIPPLPPPVNEHTNIKTNHKQINEIPSLPRWDDSCIHTHCTLYYTSHSEGQGYATRLGGVTSLK